MGELSRLFLFTPVWVEGIDLVVTSATSVTSVSSSDISNMSGDEERDITDSFEAEGGTAKTAFPGQE